MENPGQGHSYFAWDGMGWARTQEEYRGGLEHGSGQVLSIDQELIQLRGVAQSDQARLAPGTRG